MKNSNTTEQKDHEIQVIIPYRQLEELIQAGAELKALRFELKASERSKRCFASDVS